MSLPKYLLVKGKAGLGNRMLCALTGLLYARVSGRQAVIDWRDFAYSNAGENAFPRLFECGEAGSETELPSNGSVLPRVWDGHLDRSANDMLDTYEAQQHAKSAKHGSAAWWAATVHKRYSADLRRTDYPEDTVVMWSFGHQIGALRRHLSTAQPELARLTADAILGKMLRAALRPQALIRERVTEFQRQEFKAPVIGVHVRYMDRRASLSDFIQHIDRIIRRVPNAQLFLSTDNDTAQAEVRRRYGADRVVSTVKWFPSSGVSMHQNPECPDRFQHAVDALVDMYLLSRCDYLIYPGSSTFSYISSLVSDAPRSQIIDIERFNVRIRVKRFVKALVA